MRRSSVETTTKAKLVTLHKIKMLVNLNMSGPRANTSLKDPVSYSKEFVPCKK